MEYNFVKYKEGHIWEYGLNLYKIQLIYPRQKYLFSIVIVKSVCWIVLLT